MDRTGLEFHFVFAKTRTVHTVILTTFMVLEPAGLLRPQIYDANAIVCERLQSAMESAYSWNCVGRCSQLHSHDDCEECVVEMHIPPIKGTAHVTFKVVAGTEPTLSMPILVANGHRLVYRGEDTVLSTGSRGNVAPLTSGGDDWYLKVLINSENVYIRIDVWAACHGMPAELGSMPEPGDRGKENHARVNNHHQDTERS